MSQQFQKETKTKKRQLIHFLYKPKKNCYPDWDRNNDVKNDCINKIHKKRTLSIGIRSKVNSRFSVRGYMD